MVLICTVCREHPWSPEASRGQERSVYLGEDISAENEGRDQSQKVANSEDVQRQKAQALDTGLWALSAIAGYYRISVSASQIAHDLGLANRCSDSNDVLRGARRIGLKAKLIHRQSTSSLDTCRCRRSSLCRMAAMPC